MIKFNNNHTFGGLFSKKSYTLELIRPLLTGIIFLFLCELNLTAQTELSGLFFSSHETIQDERTSLNLTPHKPFHFSGYFSLEFDINFRRDDGYYGYIFRIIANKNENIDLVSNVASDESNICLVYKDRILLNYRWADLPSIDFDQWVKVRIDFDLKDDRIMVSLNEKRKEIHSPGITHLQNFQMYFGQCKAPGFYSTDVCPMSVKNISIYKADHKLFRQWTLGRHSRNKTFDNIAHAEAGVENPNWLIDKYIRWRKLTEINVNNTHGITPDAIHKGIYIVDDKAVYFLSYKSLKIDTIHYSGGCPYLNELRHDVIFNKYTDEIWSYDFNNAVISRFNLKTGKWSNDQPDMSLSDYGHHNKFISPIDSSLITILGYGHYRYKSTVNVHKNATHEWLRIDRSDQIAPRYLSGAGHINKNKALVFGGYGSNSGRQELSPQSYYDLYTFNFSDYSFTPIWTLPVPDKPFVSSETIVANESDDCFYALLFNKDYHDSYLQLARFRISQPEMIMIGDSIPFKFHDAETWTYLYLNEEQSDLIAVVAHKNKITLYAIAYPPLVIEDTLQHIPANNLSHIFIGGFILVVLFIIGVLFIIKRKSKQLNPLMQKQINENITIEPLLFHEQRQTSAIYLMGGFQSFDQKGENITSLFSPTLKQLFFFLLFNSVEERKGISSARLDEVLWHDKTGNSARNNRNVNISKLRTVLERIHFIEITNKNALWQIEITADIYCDYLDIIHLINKFKTDILTEDDVYYLLEILQNGDLAPDIQADWIFSYKSEFSKKVVDMMSHLLSNPETYPNISIRYHIAEYLLSVDPLNEEAIHVKCTLLNKTGKTSLAKIHFDLFAKAYEELIGSPYPRSFGEVVK